MTDEIGERVGAYRLEAQLGRGGMGIVYRARGPDGGLVALKRLELAEATDETLTRFLREASIRIRHPNVVRVVGAGADAAGRPYLVMELLEGESLDRSLQRGLDTRRVVEIGTQLCRGLEALHATGLVHRDVKPSNVFVCNDGTVKLLDLGIALATQGATMITRSGSVIGTPAYLAPEQARGRRVDPRADVWAVGLILYEALTGVNPFRRDTQLATMLALVAEPAPPIGAGRRPVARRLARIVERCLSKDPEARLPTATALGEALAKYLEDHDDAVGAGLEEPAIEGERRVVAVLIAEGVERSDVLLRALEQAGGEVLPFTGDRVAGIFGADTSRGDELRRALDAAFDARGAARSMAIACGHATRRGGFFSGDALAEAGRAANHAAGEIVVGPTTMPLLEPYAEMLERAPGVFEVIGRRASTVRATSVRPQTDPSMERAPQTTGGTAHATPLVGRATELAAIGRARDVWRDERRAVCVLVSGALGCGKSRLADAAVELFEQAGPDIEVRVARADDRGMPLAFSMLRNASIPPSPPASEPDSGGSAQVDPAAMADRARLEILGAIEHRLAMGPLAIVLEDAHGADRASLDLVDELPSRFADRPLLLLVTARPELLETQPDLWVGHDLVERIVPSPLRAGDVARIVEAVAGRPAPEGLASALADHTGGNPLFVEQIVRALVDLRRLDDPPDRWPLPLTVEAAVQARLDRLPPDDKECLKRLALFRRPATAEELESIGVDGAAQLLGALVRRELVTRGASGGSPSARFFRVRSAVIADVAYGMMPDEVRRPLHGEAAIALATRVDVEPEEVALHHDAAGEAPEAAIWFARAALESAARGDGLSVLRCVPRALRRGAPEGKRFALHLALAEAARFARHAALEGDALEAARQAATDDRQRALAAIEHAEWLRRTGRVEDALHLGAEAIGLAERAGDPDVRVRAACRHASALLFAGHTARAADALDSVAALRSSVTTATRAIFADVEGYVAGTVGDHGARREAYVRAAALYAEAGDVRRAAGAASNAADAANRVGDYQDAEAELRRCLVTCRSLGNKLAEGYGLANLGHALAATERHAEALDVLRPAREIARSLGDPYLEAAAALYALEARLALGAADDVAHEAAALAADPKTAAALVVAAWALAAKAALRAGDPERSLAHAIVAVDLLDRGPVEEGEAAAFLALGDALQAVGRSAEAFAVRKRGCARIEAIASRIRDPEWRRRFLEDVAEHQLLQSSALAATRDGSD